MPESSHIRFANETNRPRPSRIRLAGRWIGGTIAGGWLNLTSLKREREYPGIGLPSSSQSRSRTVRLITPPEPYSDDPDAFPALLRQRAEAHDLSEPTCTEAAMALKADEFILGVASKMFHEQLGRDYWKWVEAQAVALNLDPGEVYKTAFQHARNIHAAQHSPDRSN